MESWQCCMYGLPLDHFQRLVIILYCYMSSIDECVELFKTKTDREALSLYIGISGLNIYKCFTGEGYRLVVLEECSTESILTGIGLQDKGLCVVKICQSGPKKKVANPGLQAVKCLICGEASDPICYLFPEEGSFRCKAREKRLQVIN